MVREEASHERVDAAGHHDVRGHLGPLVGPQPGESHGSGQRVKVRVGVREHDIARLGVVAAWLGRALGERASSGGARSARGAARLGSTCRSARQPARADRPECEEHGRGALSRGEARKRKTSPKEEVAGTVGTIEPRIVQQNTIKRNAASRQAAKRDLTFLWPSSLPLSHQRDGSPSSSRRGHPRLFPTRRCRYGRRPSQPVVLAAGRPPERRRRGRSRWPAAPRLRRQPCSSRVGLAQPRRATRAACCAPCLLPCTGATAACA